MDGTATCIVTNTFVETPPVLGTITVVKTVTNDNGGTLIVSDFPLFVDATAVTSGSVNSYAAGTYTVSETNAVGYAATFGGDCGLDGSITVADGENLTCTITNDDIAPTLTVTKLVNGGTAVSADFSMTLTGTDVSMSAFPGDASGTIITLDAGAFEVGEVIEADYFPSFFGDCDGVLALGQVAACTISNNYAPPPPQTGRILIDKDILGNDAAVPSDFQYTITVDGVETTSYFEDSGAIVLDLVAGSVFSVVEVDPGVQYAASYSGICSGTMAADAVVECDVVNTFQTDDLHIYKVIVGSDAVPSDFQYILTHDGIVDAPASFLDVGHVIVNLPVGTVYSVVEVANPDYTTTYSATPSEDCGEITPEVVPANSPLNDGVECTITNEFIVIEEPPVIIDPIRPSLLCVEPNVGEGMSIAHFGYDSENDASVFIDAGTIDNLMLGGGSTEEDRGQPEIFESGAHPDSFLLAFQTGIDVTWMIGSYSSRSISTDGATICDEPADTTTTLTVNKVLIQNNGATDAIANMEFFIDNESVANGVFTDAFNFTSVTDVEPGVSHVVSEGFDVNPEGVDAVSDLYTVTFSGDCDASGNVVVALGEDAVCTITNDDIAPPTPPSGGGSTGGGRSDGDNPAPPNNDVPDPVVLGETDEADPADEPAVINPVPTPIVLGDADELPRTGLPVAGLAPHPKLPHVLRPSQG